MNKKIFKYVDKFSSKQKASFIVALDIFVTALTLIIAFLLRFGFTALAITSLVKFWWYIPLFVSIQIGTFQNFGIYTFLWRYASIKELVSVVKAITLSSFLIMAFLFVTSVGHKFPASILLIDWALNIITIGSTRVMIRLFKDYHKITGQISKENRAKLKNLLIIGAGDAAEMIAREILKSSTRKYNLIGFVDDNKNKIGQNIHQLPVLGTTKNMIALTAKFNIEEVIIAIPSAKGIQIRNIVKLCDEANLKVKVTPAMQDIINGKVSVSQLREVQIEDLLGRDVIETDITAISAYLAHKIVLVTGAGGSIGSEMCRQILKFSPKKLIMLDNCENNVYQIDMELGNLHLESTELIPLVCDVKNQARLNQVFSQFKPQIVFHAAAYKHVPLMELNTQEVIFNNIYGTKQILDTAAKFEVERCVLISTDKAVNPTNCMGATKRVAEVLMQLKAAETTTTTFAAVRFGNVLGSQGSVVPLFKKQIAAGGPITVTHPEVTRFFMTIPEAVRLVIQAGALAAGGEIFVLDMGDSVKIIDLAKDMVHLSGLELGRDIEIKFTGLRPGEKLYEELFYNKEGLKTTGNKKIFIAEPTLYNKEVILKQIMTLLSESAQKEDAELRNQLFSLVQTLDPQHQKNKDVR